MGEPRTIRARSSTAATARRFAPFGVLPPDEGDGHPTADLEFLCERRLGELHRRTRSTRSRCVDGRLRCELLNRHDTHTQTLMPMSGDALVVVAPADVDFSEPRTSTRCGRSRSRSTRVCICTAARGTGVRIPSAPTTSASSTSRAAATRTTTGSSWLTRDHGVVYEVAAQV